jgi:Flp pilus assembly protein TadG
VIQALRRRLRLSGDDSGSAVVEFTLLVVPLLVPLVYLIFAMFEAQRTAFAVAEGARQGGRAYVTAGGGTDARTRALYAANLAVVDQGLPALAPAAVSIDAPQGFCAGGRVTITLRGTASLPLLPKSAAKFAVSASHTEVIDELQGLPPCG